MNKEVINNLQNGNEELLGVRFVCSKLIKKKEVDKYALDVAQNKCKNSWFM